MLKLTHYKSGDAVWINSTHLVFMTENEETSERKEHTYVKLATGDYTRVIEKPDHIARMISK